MLDKNTVSGAREYEENFFELTDSGGNTERFELLDVVEYNGSDYAVLLPAGDNDGRVHIFEIIEELDSEWDTYAGLDSQETVDKVYEVFRKKHRDEYNFTD